MWTTFQRARRRLGGGATTIDAAAVIADEPPSPQAVEDVVIVLGRVEVDRLRHALQATLGDVAGRPDTPALIECAIALLLTRADAPGRPRVLRRPAGLTAPEAWEIHLDGVEPSAGLAVREAGRTGRFET